MPVVDTGHGEVVAELDDGVLVVTLNRPEAKNALSLPLLDGLAVALDVAATSDAVRAVVLTGAGDAFCSGGDIGLMAAGHSIFGDPDDVTGRVALQAELQRRTVVRLRDLDKPTVAVLPGAAVGAGLALALACDVRHAAESAVLMTGFGRVGLAGDFGCSWLLHDLVGRSIARELLYSSAAVSAASALEWGLVNAVHPDDTLERDAMRVARRFARVPAPAVAVMTQTSALAGTLGFAEACDRDAEQHVQLASTVEHRALVEALVRDRSTAQEARR